MSLATALLVSLILVPGACTLFAACAARRRDLAIIVATIGSTYTLAAGIGLFALTTPWRSAADTATLDVPWIALLGSRLHLGWDGISAPLVLLTCLLTLLCCLYLWGSGDDAGPASAGRPPSAGLVAMLLATQTASIATFVARDLLVFFIAFEAVLIPMWVLIGRWGGDPSATEAVRHAARRDAATRFVLFTATGSAVMLVGLIVLAIACDSTDFGVIAERAPLLPLTEQVVIAVLLVIGFGVKVPVWPLHAWLPPAHTAAPTVGSVLLAGVLLKLGSYGLVRLVAGFVPGGLAQIALVVGLLGVTGIFWGGLCCLVERDFKRLVAFSSVAHMGFVLLGVASGRPEGLQGALFVGIAHGLITGLLFWVVGMIKYRHLAARSADLTVLPAGLRDSHPALGWALAFACIASLGLPGLAGFWGEFATLLGAWRSADLGAAGPVLASLGALGTVLAAAYLLRVLYLIWHGESLGNDPDSVQQPDTTRSSDLAAMEKLVVAPLVLAIILFGVQPGLLMSISAPAVRALVGAP